MPPGKKNRPGLELQDRDIEMFRGLFESRLMTLEHITRLYFNGRSEAAKKRVQRLKSGRYLGERVRNLYEPSILYLAERAFTALVERGAIHKYPSLTWSQLKKRLHVSDFTLRHERSVLDVKTSISCALRPLPHYELVEFSTWPRLYQFEAAQPPRPGTYSTPKVVIKPDGFVRIYEHANSGDTFEHMLFLEVDRSTESRKTLALRTYGYQDFYCRGGLAVRFGHGPEDFEAFPFRVLFVVPNEERRNNLAEQLLLSTPPVLAFVWLTTFQEVTTDPLGAIWMQPIDYRNITHGTEFDPSRECTNVYRRRKEREEFVAGELNKLSLFEVE
jgi:hypothetical protein